MNSLLSLFDHYSYTYIAHKNMENCIAIALPNVSDMMPLVKICSNLQ